MPRNEGAGKKPRTPSGLALGGAVHEVSLLSTLEKWRLQQADRTDYTKREAQGKIKTGPLVQKLLRFKASALVSHPSGCPCSADISNPVNDGPQTGFSWAVSRAMSLPSDLLSHLPVLFFPCSYPALKILA